MSKKFPDLSKDNIEHKLLEQQIKALVVQQNANFEVLNDRLTEILHETRKTNGRVTKLEDIVVTKTEFKKLEDETKVVRFLQKNKVVLILVILGFYTLFQALDFEKIMKFFM
jgi:membrane-bound ClpP family serine protease